MWNRNCFTVHWTSWHGRMTPASLFGYYWEACFLTKFSSSGLPFFGTTFIFWELGLWFSFLVFGCSLLVPWSPSFISFFPLTYVYDMCKCGGVIRYTVRRPKYPSKSSLFLGSLSHASLPRFWRSCIFEGVGYYTFDLNCTPSPWKSGILLSSHWHYNRAGQNSKKSHLE